MTLAIHPLETDVAGPSAMVQTSFSTGQFILVRNSQSVMNVGKPSAPPSPLTIRKFMLGRNPINAKDVERPSVGVQPLLNIRELMLERNHH
jgi:hypothetical protein